VDRALRLGLELAPPPVGAREAARDPHREPSWAFLREVVAAAEDGGFGAVWLSAGAGEVGSPDPCTLAGGLAPTTAELVLGVVAAVGPREREPSVLARDLTALDLVSGGRAAVLLEAGDDASPEMVDEAARVCRVLFRGGSAEFTGDYFRLVNAVNNPGPSRPGGPPVLTEVVAGTPGAEGRVVRGGADEVSAVAPAFWRGELPSDADSAAAKARALLDAGAVGLVVRLDSDGALPEPHVVATVGARLAPAMASLDP